MIGSLRIALLLSITPILMPARMPAEPSANPFGVFTINRGLWGARMPDAAWDRGFVRLHTIIKNQDGTFAWAGSPTSPGVSSNFYGAGCFERLPSDRNWVLCLDGLPPWLQADPKDVLTPNNWTDFENLISWVVAQFPPQVKVLEIANEYGWWDTTSRAWPDAATMAEYIKRVSRTVRQQRPDLTVAGPAWVNTSSFLRERFAELAACKWSDGTRTLDWLGAISMHNYSGLDEVGAEAKFGRWSDDLAAWYQWVDTLGYARLPHYWTEFGFPLKYNNQADGHPAGRAVTAAEAARFYARAMTLLKARNAACILPFSLASFDGHGGTQDFGFHDETNTTRRPAYFAATTTMAFLKDAGPGTILHDGTRTVVNFSDRAVIWDSASRYSYDPGYTIRAAIDLKGDPVIPANARTVPVGPDPVFVTKKGSSLFSMGRIDRDVAGSVRNPGLERVAHAPRYGRKAMKVYLHAPCSFSIPRIHSLALVATSASEWIRAGWPTLMTSPHVCHPLKTAKNPKKNIGSP
ncbi:MAG: hypothetical protein WC205_09295 [Opitutaceae bacterium]|jgi:hypothetical protein